MAAIGSESEPVFINENGKAQVASQLKVGSAPLWSSEAQIPISSGSAIPEDGYLIVSPNKYGRVMINNVVLGFQPNNSNVVAVASGDYIQFLDSGVTYTASFLPITDRRKINPGNIETIKMLGDGFPSELTVDHNITVAIVSAYLTNAPSHYIHVYKLYKKLPGSSEGTEITKWSLGHDSARGWKSFDCGSIPAGTYLYITASMVHS